MSHAPSQSRLRGRSNPLTGDRLLACSGLLLGVLAPLTHRPWLGLPGLFLLAFAWWRLQVRLAKNADQRREVQAMAARLRAERRNMTAFLGSGVAHDVNNLLGAIRNSVELIEMEIDEERPPSPRDLKRIIEATDRATGMLRRTMEHARRDRVMPQPMELREVIGELMGELAPMIPDVIEIHLEEGPEALPVLASKEYLETILVDLCTNAIDALPDGGILTVRTEKVQDLARFSVKDSGTGLCGLKSTELFETFNTTKAPGEGLGLGLHAVRRLVRELGGSVSVDSEPSEGFCVRVDLPIRRA